MSIKAVFIGVNKHADNSIPELNGACRDATALWALFTDSIPGLSSQLLVNEQATYERMRRAIFDTLSSASEVDAVIITFAGHGSSDGRLVAHDTTGSNLPGTAISMTEIAQAFQSSNARVVLCILDCCFSGQAPARVLETHAKARNAFTFQGIYGEGRFLLAACAADEAAWEQPGTGHGLLTFSVIQAMMGDEGTCIQFPDVTGEIVRQARVEAERIGVTQTPISLGSIKGGLAFPALRRGENFSVAFPSIPIIQLNGKFTELSTYGVSQEIVGQWESRFPNGLNDLQLTAVNKHGVLAGCSLLVVAPTSSGKTMVGELAAVQAVLQGKKAAFLLPYRALVNEKFEEFTARYEAAGLRVIRCSGDAADGVSPALTGRYDIGFFTYEMFLNMALTSPRLLSQLGVVIIDEGQFITDPTRGITVELIFALLLRARDQGINPQLLVLSAVIGSLNGFDNWLGLPVLLSHQRPVPLIEGVLDRHGTFQFVDVDGSTKQEALLPRHLIVQRRDKPSSQDVIVPLAKQLVSNGEKIIIFRNMRGPAQGCAKYLAAELGLSAATSVLAMLPQQDLTASSEDLRACLRRGTAFHSTNLLRGEKEAVEQGFRNANGGIHALAATTTLAAGINTPASTVILAENEFLGEDGRPFTVAEYKNMAGRAGRLGFNETGKAIILADTPIERAQLFRKYVLGAPECVSSSFQVKDLPTWTLRLLSQVRGVRVGEIATLLVNTFGGYCASRDNPDWGSNVKASIDALVSRMIEARLVELEGDILHLTLLGRACGTSSLSFESALRLVELMQRLDIAQTPPSHVLAIIQVLSECDSIYTPVMKKGRSESVRLNDVSIRYGSAITNALQRFCSHEIQVWQRCKRAAILWDWTSGTSVDELERRYTANPFQGAIGYGDIIRIADSTRFHLRSAHQILTALFPENVQFLTGLEEVLIQVEYGLPNDAIGLTKIRPPISRGQLLALYESGCRTPEDVTRMSKEKLIQCVGAFVADLLQ